LTYIFRGFIQFFQAPQITPLLLILH